MKVEFDPAKDASNIAKHGLSLADFAGFDISPVVLIDDRYVYGETRYIALGRIAGSGYCIVYTLTGNRTRLISFRRAHERRCVVMNKLPPDYDDNPEWTDEDFARARPASEMFGEDVMSFLVRKPGRPAGSVTSDRQQVTLRLPRAVIDHFKAGGPGWQTRAIAVLEREAKRG